MTNPKLILTDLKNLPRKALQGFRNHYRVITPFIVAPMFLLALFFREHPAMFVVGTVLLVLIAIVVNTFVVIYSRRNWRANPYGRALMYSKMSLAVLVNLSLATAFLGPDWELRAVLRVFLFAGILVAQTRLLQLLFSAPVTRQASAQRMKDIEGA